MITGPLILAGLTVQPLANFNSGVNDYGTEIEVLNTTGNGKGGIFINAGFRILTRDINSPVAEWTMNYTIDGHTESIKVFYGGSNGLTWDGGFDNKHLDVATNFFGDGTTVGDNVVVYFGLVFKTGLRVTISSTGNNIDGYWPEISCTVLWAQKY